MLVALSTLDYHLAVFDLPEVPQVGRKLLVPSTAVPNVKDAVPEEFTGKKFLVQSQFGNYSPINGVAGQPSVPVYAVIPIRPIYSRQAPKWVQADRVVAARNNRLIVDVTVADQNWKGCRVDWNNGELPPDKIKSDVLVQNEEEDYLRVWFHDEDVVLV